MLDALKFVVGAASRKDFVEELTHLFIHEGTAIAYDGVLAMSSPIAINLKVRPHARTFVNALRACDDDASITLHVTPAGRLSVKSGAFRVLVPCIDFDAAATIPKPEGADVALTPELVESIRALAPLMATDASRPWARGLRIKGDSSYATNNVILAERWHGAKFPHEIILPADCVAELLRAREAPVRAQVCENSITFHYENGRWLRSQLVVGEWPDRIDELFSAAHTATTPVAIGDELFPSLEKLKKFSDDRNRVFIHADRISTHQEDSDGAVMEMTSDGDGACFSLDMLMKLNGIATHISFASYPNPCPFKGKMMRGVILGQRY